MDVEVGGKCCGLGIVGDWKSVGDWKKCWGFGELLGIWGNVRDWWKCWGLVEFFGIGGNLGDGDWGYSLRIRGKNR